jgi:uncharacterized protein YuzE
MADMTVEKIIPFAHDLVESTRDNLWINYDRDADVLYISLFHPDEADDTEYRDDGIIVRYRDGTVIGYTIPSFSRH